MLGKFVDDTRNSRDTQSSFVPNQLTDNLPSVLGVFPSLRETLAGVDPKKRPEGPVYDDSLNGIAISPDHPLGQLHCGRRSVAGPLKTVVTANRGVARLLFECGPETDGSSADKPGSVASPTARWPGSGRNTDR